MTSKKILVTGGTGLVGSHLLYQLTESGYSVRAFIRNKKNIEKVQKVFSYYTADPTALINRIEWFEGDVLDISALEEAFENISVVYHCAAVVSFNKKNKTELLKTNIEGTENIVNLCLEKQPVKLCFVSSVASLGSSENGNPVTEKEMWTPADDHSLYSITKFKSEMEVWRGLQEGLNAVIVNPSVILGPGFWDSGSGEIINKASRGMLFYTLGKTGFVDVRDVVSCMIQLTESNITGERYILNSENLTYQDVFNKIATEAKVKKPKYLAGKKLLTLAYYVDSLVSFWGLKKQQITKSIVRSGLNITQYSNKKVKDTLDFEFIPINKSIRFAVEKFNQDLKARK
ncbi:MAG: NAD-dependent epimerase/dehydratase family protein [Bacteroidales bacterium]